MRPVLGLSNQTFKKRWDDIIQEAEKKLLQAQCAFIEDQRIHQESESIKAKQSLKDKLGEDSPDYKEAISAVSTVTNRVRQEVTLAERKRWLFSLEQLENQQLGINPRRPARRQAPPQPSNAGQQRNNRIPSQRRPTNPRGRNNNRNVLKDIMNILGGR